MANEVTLPEISAVKRSLPLGVLVHGAFLGAEIVEDRDGTAALRIGLGIGIKSVTVYIKGTPDSNGVSALSFGDDVLVSCRAWAGKNGVGFSDGSIV